MPFCGKCGTEVEPMERFCADCGNPLDHTKTSPQIQNNFPKRTIFSIFPVVTIFLLAFGGIAAVIMFSNGFISTNKDQIPGPLETKIDEPFPTVVADASAEINKSFTEICDGWLMGGANLANSYFNASEKELLPPFIMIKEIMIPEGFEGEDITLDDESIYISGNHNNNDNAVYKFDRFNGELLWNFNMSDASGSCSCPVSITDQYVVCGGQWSENLYILDKKTGELVKAKEIVLSLYTKPPKVDNGLVYVYGWTSLSEYQYGLLCYDIETDAIKWATSTGHLQSEIAIFNDYIIAGKSNDEYDSIYIENIIDTVVYSKKTGDMLWETQEPRGISITTDGEYVYTLTGDIENWQGYYDKVVSYRIDSGVKEWEKQISFAGGFFSKLAASTQFLVVAASNYHAELNNSKILVFDTLSGALIGEMFVNGYVTSLALANGYAYISTTSAFYAYNLNSNILEIIEELSVKDIAISNGNLVILTWEKILIYESINNDLEFDLTLLLEENVFEQIIEPETNVEVPTVTEPLPSRDVTPNESIDDSEFPDWWVIF